MRHGPRRGKFDVCNIDFRAKCGDEAGGSASLTDRLVSGVMSSQVLYRCTSALHLAAHTTSTIKPLSPESCTLPKKPKPLFLYPQVLNRLQASFLGFARSILGGKKKGGGGWVDNVKEGQALQVCFTVCVVMALIILIIMIFMLVSIAIPCITPLLSA